MKTVLAIESSTAFGGIALSNAGQILFDENCLEQKSHSEKLNQYLQNAMNEQKIQLSELSSIIVGNGPGSFTGIRVAINIARAIGFSYQTPIYTCDSLTNVALNGLGHKEPVLVIINAFKNMVYFGLFDCSGSFPKFLKGPGAIDASKVSTLISDKTLVLGDGFKAYEHTFSTDFSTQILRKPVLSDFPSCQNLLNHQSAIIKHGPEIQWKSLIPLYIRPSSAEENLQKL